MVKLWVIFLPFAIFAFCFHKCMLLFFLYRNVPFEVMLCRIHGGSSGQTLCPLENLSLWQLWVTWIPFQDI